MTALNGWDEAAGGYKNPFEDGAESFSEYLEAEPDVTTATVFITHFTCPLPDGSRFGFDLERETNRLLITHLVNETRGATIGIPLPIPADTIDWENMDVEPTEDAPGMVIRMPRTEDDMMRQRLEPAPFDPESIAPYDPDSPDNDGDVLAPC